jgi:hypothetical protein
MRAIRLLVIPLALSLPLALLLPLGGCTWLANTLGGTPDQSSKTAIVEGFIDACDIYAATLKDAAVAAQAHLLNEATIAKIKAARPGVESICPPQGTMPENATGALVSVVQGTAQIVAAVKGAKP